MTDLEKLVPPLGLCKQIPKGAFEDSVLSYFGCKYTDNIIVAPTNVPRANDDVFRICPAPTLKELMEALGHALCVKWSHPVRGMHWLVKRSDFDDGLLDDSPETAALKLWLELERKKHEQQG